MKFTFKTSFSVLLCALLFSACAPVAVQPSIISASPGDVLYQESFTDNTSGWDRALNDGGIMDYDSGGFRILVRQPKMNFWSTPGGSYGDVRVEADVTRLAGPAENRVGLMCRYQNGNYYFFIISTDGFYSIGKFTGGVGVLAGAFDEPGVDVLFQNFVVLQP